MAVNPTAHPPRRLTRCSYFLVAKDHASTHSPCCCNRTSIRTNSTNCSPKGFAALHAVMPFALAASFVTAAPVSCIPLRSVVLHYTPLRSIRWPALTFIAFGLSASAQSSHINTNSIHFQRKLIPLHFVSFSPLSLSKLQATRCHCCARLRCRPGCGLSCFLHLHLLADARPAPFNNQPHRAKNHASPCSCGHCSTHNTFRGLLIVRIALLWSGFNAHTLPPARGTHFVSLRSPWAARKLGRPPQTT